MAEKLDCGAGIPGTNNLTVSDFWSWAYSDILSNRNRSVFAEFLVASTLGQTNEPRVEWDAVDVRYKGKGIEVKSAAYWQSWNQTKRSVIRFDIAKKYGWDSKTDERTKVKVRSSDCYVFCVLGRVDDEEKPDVLDIDQWKFYVVSTKVINDTFKEQRSIGLSSVEWVCKNSVSYHELKDTIHSIMNIKSLHNIIRVNPQHQRNPCSESRPSTPTTEEKP